MFSPDSELIHIASHVSGKFHCMIGLDPLGNFSAIENLSYEIPAFEYAELGRNHSAIQLPFAEPGKPGELTMRWGMIIRSKLYEWIHEVEIGGDYRRGIYIFQLSQKALPLRLYHLTGAWPTSWKGTELSCEGPATMQTEEIVLAYDQIDMVNLSLIAMAGQLLDEPLSDLADAIWPPAADKLVARDSAQQLTPFVSTYVPDMRLAASALDEREATYVQEVTDAVRSLEELLEIREARKKESDQIAEAGLSGETVEREGSAYEAVAGLAGIAEEEEEEGEGDDDGDADDDGNDGGDDGGAAT